MVFPIQDNVSPDIKFRREIFLKAILNLRNRTAWTIITVLTLITIALFSVAAKFQSEVDDAPTMFSNIVGVLSFFFISCSLFLSLGNKSEKKYFNVSLIAIGMLVFLFKVLVAFYNVGISNRSTIGTLVIALIALAIILIYFKKVQMFLKG